ncbi:MAG: hypothetical protein ACRCUY_09035 [Thermoguttaceae bacterium]
MTLTKVSFYVGAQYEIDIICFQVDNDSHPEQRKLASATRIIIITRMIR